MAFVELRDGRGLLYVPDRRPGRGKHDCPDCHDCQGCGDDRCGLCRERRTAREEAPEAPLPEKPSGGE